MHVVTTDDGTTLAAFDLGGTGPDLVLAHATGFHGLVWLPLVAHLRASFRCVAFDTRGHGDSRPRPGETFAWEGFAADVLAVVRELELQRPFGVGHSCGGAALLLAEEADPGAFRSLWCYEPVVLPVDDPPAPTAESSRLADTVRRRRETFGSRAEALANYRSKPPFDALDPVALEAYVHHGFEDVAGGSVRLKCRSVDEASVYEQGGAHAAFRDLDRVACPVTLATGERTRSFPADFYAPHTRRLAHARIEVLAGLGHFGPLEDPGAVAAAVLRAFLPA